MTKRWLITIWLSIGLCAFADAARADDVAWSSAGPFQGMSVARVTAGPGNSIAVSCDVANGSGSSVTFELAGRAPGSDTLFVSFDGRPAQRVFLNAEGPEGFYLTAGCPACDMSFDALIEELKSGNAVVVTFPTDESASFSLRGSRAAIGDCPAQFDEQAMVASTDDGASAVPDNIRGRAGRYAPLGQPEACGNYGEASLDFGSMTWFWGGEGGTYQLANPTPVRGMPSILFDATGSDEGQTWEVGRVQFTWVSDTGLAGQSIASGLLITAPRGDGWSVSVYQPC
jgi:hypothetical protein